MKKTINIQAFLLCISLFLIQFAIFTKNIIFITNYAQNLINAAIVILFINSIYVLSKIKINIKNWIIYTLMLGLAISSFIITKDSLILQLFLITISSIKINFKKIIKYDIVFKLILLSFIVLCYYKGYALTEVFTRDGELRYAYGFNQPNAFGYFLLLLFFEIIYIKHNRIKLYKIFFLFFIIYFFINSASSRSAQIAICMFMLIYTVDYIRTIYIKSKKRNNIDAFNLLKIGIPILTLISIILTKEFINKTELAIKINDLFSDRLLLQSMFINEYNFNLLGNNIYYFDTLDNLYIRLLLNYGLVTLMLYILIYNKIITKSIKNKDKIILMIVFVFFIYGIMEWYIIRPAINIFLIYFSATLTENKNNKNNKTVYGG